MTARHSWRRGALALLLLGGACALQAAEVKSKPGPASDSQSRTILFSGYEWVAKTSGPDRRVGPGGNYFSDSTDNVSVDNRGRLHLKIVPRVDDAGRTRWYCAEVISARSFGRGTYRWYLDTPVAADPDIVLGLFTWDDTSATDHHREIDIELISTWQDAGAENNAQFVVQPWDEKGRRQRWTMPSSGPAATSTHAFTWRSDSVEFISLPGHARQLTAETPPLQAWTFRGKNIPAPGAENARMNFWLLKRLAEGRRPPEVIISKFEFVAEEIPANPKIELTSVPDTSLKPGPIKTGPISGHVSGASTEDCKVIVYALGGDTWHVQPLASEPDTAIHADGKWLTRTHGGEEYAALLVQKSYVGKAELKALPKEGGQILAIARKPPQEP